MADLVQRHADQVPGVLPCFDRVIVRGWPAEIVELRASSLGLGTTRRRGSRFCVPTARCTYRYFYFGDEHLGLAYLWVRTWCRIGVQAYFNGYNRLAAKLRDLGIVYEMLGNARTCIADSEIAQFFSTVVPRVSVLLGYLKLLSVRAPGITLTW